MLSRVADNLFWMSRYLERAESLTALVSTHTQMSLDIPAEQSRQLSRDWTPLLDGLGMLGGFRQVCEDTGAESVSGHLLFNRQLAGSVTDCLARARENARTVREQITPEMWEQINRIFLWGTGSEARSHFQRNAYEFYQRLMKSLQLFQGIVGTMMIRGDGWEFLQLGKFLERSDKVARWLDDRFHLLRPGEPDKESMAGWSEFMTREETEAPDRTGVDRIHYNWSAVLRVCHARSTYQRLYPSIVQPSLVAELLLLNEDFPRSMLFCVSRIERSLRRMSRITSGRYSGQAERLGGRLASRLRYTSMEEIRIQGLRSLMIDLQDQLEDIGEAIQSECINSPLTQPTA